ncbi:MAG TPA: DUF5683 domain-containing protein [Polyangiaceae bacterium]
MADRHLPNPHVAAVLSFVLPGLGQLYNGKFWRAIFWFLVAGGVWIGTWGTWGWICHILCAFTAYHYASKLAERGEHGAQ